MHIFSIAPTWLWGAFIAGIIFLLLIDLVVFHKKPHEVKLKEAICASIGWIAVALAFNVWFGFYFGSELGVEFLTGYLVEKSLSLDNLFVIYLIFQAFKIPPQHHHRVLYYGILGAILMRGVMIIIGAQLVQQFHWILYIFGAILIFSGIKFLRETDEPVNITKSRTVTLLSKLIPLTQNMNHKKFFLIEEGVKKATPLFLALVLIEITDLVFALDSIPAVFAVTSDPFIAFASNILAILGLRALYFVIASAVAQLRFLKPGLATLLIFIGIKMLIEDYYDIPSWASLLVIMGILTTAALSSWYVNELDRKNGK